MKKEFKNVIGGREVDSHTGKTFRNINPADREEVLGIFPDSDAADVDDAVKCAKQSFYDWRSTPAPKRAEIIYRAARLLESRKPELAKIITSEVGKSYESSLGDVQSGIDMANFIAGEGRRMLGDTMPSALPKRFAMTKRYPVGVVGVITSWNFPMAITCWKTLPALVAGNAVVLKAEENSPETNHNFAMIMKEAGLPDGVLNTVHGSGPAAGKALVEHKDVDMITFTGSSMTGKEIGKSLANRLAKASLELGGKNAVLVMDDADLDLAAEGTIMGAFSVSGQRCTSTTRAIIHEKIYSSFVERLLERTRKLKIGPGMNPENVVTPIINECQFNRVMKYVEDAVKGGAKILCGGKALTTGEYSKGYYIEPTIFEGVTTDMPVWREEVFGPVLVLMKADSFENAISLHNKSDYGLSVSLFTRDINKAFTYFDDTEAGVCYVNAPTFGSEVHMPFGGLKSSGRGYREAGRAILEACTEIKTMYIDYSAKIQNAQFVEKD
jgi:aldehyde dehydrogenase (NAD+)